MGTHHAVISQMVLSSASRDSNGQSNGFNWAGFIEGRFLIDVTAISGSDTPTLTLTPQFSEDNVDFYDTNESATEITATGKTSIPITNFGRYVRLDYALSGTSPNFTFSVKFVGKT